VRQDGGDLRWMTIESQPDGLDVDRDSAEFRFNV
jgi:hypothetical protein